MSSRKAKEEGERANGGGRGEEWADSDGSVAILGRKSSRSSSTALLPSQKPSRKRRRNRPTAASLNNAETPIAHAGSLFSVIIVKKLNSLKHLVRTTVAELHN